MLLFLFFDLSDDGRVVHDHLYFTNSSSFATCSLNCCNKFIDIFLAQYPANNQLSELNANVFFCRNVVLLWLLARPRM